MLLPRSMLLTRSPAVRPSLSESAVASGALQDPEPLDRLAVVAQPWPRAAQPAVEPDDALAAQPGEWVEKDEGRAGAGLWRLAGEPSPQGLLGVRAQRLERPAVDADAVDDLGRPETHQHVRLRSEAVQPEMARDGRREVLDR